jgi:Ca2+-binding EF-hand superfamily protein
MHCHRHDINLSLFTKGVSMSSISSVGSSNAWSQTNMMRSRPPGGADPATMFKKIDSDGSGGVDATELQTMFTDMASKSGNSSNTPDASKMINQFDANSDGSLDQSEMGKAMQSMMPPPNTMDFARQRSGGSGDACGSTQSASDTSTQTMQDLLSSIDTNQDGAIDKSEMATFKQVLTESANSLTQDSSSSSGSDTTSSQSSGQTDNSRQSTMDELARMVIQRYAAMASDTAQQGNLTSLSLAA